LPRGERVMTAPTAAEFTHLANEVDAAHAICERMENQTYTQNYIPEWKAMIVLALREMARIGVCAQQTRNPVTDEMVKRAAVVIARIEGHSKGLTFDDFYGYVERTAPRVEPEARAILEAALSFPSTRLSPPAAPECECGFAADICATNHCHRKQIASAGLSPVPAGYSKLPDGAVCKCFKMWRDQNGDHWCCLPDKTRAATQPPRDGAAGGT
jgi:hypothetical protein